MPKFLVVSEYKPARSKVLALPKRLYAPDGAPARRGWSPADK